MAQPKSEKRGIIYVLDKSGSMSWGPDGDDSAPPGYRRIDSAKRSLVKNIKDIDDGVPMGLVLLPHKNPCEAKLVVENAAVEQEENNQGHTEGGR